MPDLDEIRRALEAHSPYTAEAGDVGEAAVAMVLRPAPSGPEVLLIERAKREGDPWSGQMAFPGGRVDRSDPDRRAAAERETLEEVGLGLDGAESIGRLDDLEPHRYGRAPLVVSAFVYVHETPGTLQPNHEVQEALWVPVRYLLDPDRHVDHRYPLAGDRAFAGVLVGKPERHVVWGLTYRFLESFFEILGRPFPPK